MRLLLVEDDVMLASGIKLGLNDAGYAVDWVGSGERAEEVLRSETFDAAIIDIGLPMLDGLTVLKRVRAMKPELPMLVLTALDGLEDRVAGLNAGADDYVAKPFDFPELEARMRALLRRARPSAPVDPEMGRLRFEREARRASIDGVMLELSPREWLLLDLLLMQRNRVVTKEQILRAWSADKAEPAGASGTVEVYIHRLRRKLEGSGLGIRTVRGLGYLLEAAP